MRSKLDTGIQKLDAQEKKLAANNEKSFLTKPSSQQNDQQSLDARHEKSSKTAKQDDLSASKVSPQHDREVGKSKNGSWKSAQNIGCSIFEVIADS
ncbi:hypothetical protein HGG76_27025 [Ochrobactrum tritici]|uniref:Uncharacterized protein n=1 Tax=Brucella tritici TaxID=94626 RepID=A0A7X6FSQ9_9HYPH|nr:hypothetical protein [Brucella tritici]